MSEDEAEDEACVKTGMADAPNQSWCGRNVSSEFAFVDATHALLNARQHGRLLICPKCAEAMYDALRSGSMMRPPASESF